MKKSGNLSAFLLTAMFLEQDHPCAVSFNSNLNPKYILKEARLFFPLPLPFHPHLVQTIVSG
jgi:hypothetical protein